MSAIIPGNSVAHRTSQDPVEMRNLLLPMFFLSALLCACNPSATKPTASVTGPNQAAEAAKEDARQEVHGLAPR